MIKKILVTGGAGYIGSFIVRELTSQGFEPFIVDNLSSGHKSSIDRFPFYKLDLLEDVKGLEKIFQKEKFEGVIHMASFIQMGESFRNPGKYFRNNLLSAINLLETMVKYKCTKLIFSSSAGVYGSPKELPVKEDAQKVPENPYGETKMMIEKMLFWYDKAYGIRSHSIRYFNAAGAALNGEIGEDHPNESHIIPLLIKAAINKKPFSLFGDDYKTPDGTCVRDYVHVLDLANSHVLALKALINGAATDVFNAGVGRGYSNMELIKETERISGKFKWNIMPRRPGDADSLYASTKKIEKTLGWKPKYNLRDILETAYLWHKKHPEGYRE